jgi:hypothetical protein
MAEASAPTPLRGEVPFRSSGGRVAALIAVAVAAVLIIRSLGMGFPRMDAQIALLVLIGVVLVTINVWHQLRIGRRYALINVYSGIFLSEFIVGAFVATSSATILNKEPLSTEVVTLALGLGVGGYVMLTLGYYIPAIFPGRTAREHAADLRATTDGDDDFPPRYRALLFVMLGVLIALGFVQLMLRIQKAGGFAEYLAIAYTLRYGTFADTDTANAGAVLASLLAAGALPAAALLYVAWLRGRLVAVEKWLLVAMTAVLLARQASTAFRAVVVFTLISAFAVYDSERGVSTRRLLLVGATMLLILIGVNHAHVMLHTLTGMGTATTFAESIQDLLAPHGYVETLSRVLDARARLEALQGSGMLTSILFFIPRAIWTSKVPSDEYGTGLVQGWAALPTHYQMAVTNVGELFVHFGAIGLTALLFWGIAYRWLDDKWSVGLEWRVVLLCISVPRVFPDQGMGLSAFMISLASVAFFMVPLAVAKRFMGIRGHTAPTPTQ